MESLLGKKPYVAPSMKVVAMRERRILCVSDSYNTSSEGYEEGSNDWLN